MSVERPSKRNAWVLCAVMLSSVGAFIAGRAFAGGIPGSGAMTYAGTLEDAMGVPLTGSHNLEIKLWSAVSEGTELCTTTSQAVMLVSGRFSVTLPDECTAKVQANSDAAAEVLVDGASLGRAKLGAVPYAVEALHAVTADSAATATMATSATNATSAASATSAEMASGALATTISNLTTAVDNPDAAKVILNGTNEQTAAFNITGSGHLGSLAVGTSDPIAKLELTDDAQFDPANVAAHHAVFGHVLSSPTGWDADGMCARGGAGEAMCIGVNGDNTYWGHQESGGMITRMNLDGTTGNLNITGALTQASSEALKKDVRFLDEAGLDKALAYVDDTPVATYRYKTMAESAKPIYGVIAEKTPSVLLAQGDKAVNVSSTIGVLLASIKAQQRHIKQLEARIRKLEQAR